MRSSRQSGVDATEMVWDQTNFGHSPSWVVAHAAVQNLSWSRAEHESRLHLNCSRAALVLYFCRTRATPVHDICAALALHLRSARAPLALHLR